jgi:alkanesulfonate monooxygenase SsuD/methylene tetrahydromethanopterin reductase-like flavin-dependent oxidoreductase (luciferase family)
MEREHLAYGFPFPKTRVRVDMLAEQLEIVHRLWTEERVDFHGRYYTLEDSPAQPKPLQRPHPPLLVGGGGKRVLGIAAREADMVGVHCNLRRGELDREAAADLSAERVEEKVGWVREAAREAGRSTDELELQFSTYLCRITDAPRSAQASVSSFAELLAADPELVARSPAVLVGSVEECAERLEERRERFGLSYFNLGGDVENVAPLVARLAGT